MPKKKEQEVSLELIKINELTTDLQRLQADYINFKQRSEREKVDAVRLGREMTVTQLLPVLDNLDRAFAHAPVEIQDNNWVKGVLGIQRLLTSSLDNLGISKVKTIGEVFNPETMEAVGVEEGSDSEEEIVVEEVQAGYLFEGVVIRPALVKVKK